MEKKQKQRQALASVQANKQTNKQTKGIYMSNNTHTHYTCNIAPYHRTLRSDQRTAADNLKVSSGSLHAGSIDKLL